MGTTLYVTHLEGRVCVKLTMSCQDQHAFLLTVSFPFAFGLLSVAFENYSFNIRFMTLVCLSKSELFGEQNPVETRTSKKQRHQQEHMSTRRQLVFHT